MKSRVTGKVSGNKVICRCVHCGMAAQLLPSPKADIPPLWGLMPGSIGDETSSHAYLSAMHAALMHMREMSLDKPAVEALISPIDADMVRNRASFVMCQFSGETFSTASLVMPDWRNILWHLHSLIVVGTIFLAAMAGLFCYQFALAATGASGHRCPGSDSAGEHGTLIPKRYFEDDRDDAPLERVSECGNRDRGPVSGGVSPGYASLPLRQRRHYPVVLHARPDRQVHCRTPR